MNEESLEERRLLLFKTKKNSHAWDALCVLLSCLLHLNNVSHANLLQTRWMRNHWKREGSCYLKLRSRIWTKCHHVKLCRCLPIVLSLRTVCRPFWSCLCCSEDELASSCSLSYMFCHLCTLSICIIYTRAHIYIYIYMCCSKVVDSDFVRESYKGILAQFFQNLVFFAFV